MKKIMHRSLQICFPIVLLLVIFALGHLCWSRYAYIISMGDSNGRAKEEIQKLSQGNPFPSKENLQKITQKSKDYDIDYQLYTATHKPLDLEFLKIQRPKNEVDFYFLLMAYTNFLTNYAKESAVNIPSNTAFGFEPYAQKDVIPNRKHIDALYKQSKIVAKLLILLFDSNVYGMNLHSLSRESVDSDSKTQKSGDSTGTLDQNKATAIRKNDLKSYLFSLEFSCHTNALRNYINRLQEYGLPVIVRALTIGDENKNSSGNTILSTEKVKVSMILEWLFIRDEKDDEKNDLKLEDKK
ncbi:MAG: Amuc_1100 family pilus-like protein [Puniceicoccales bacterium]|nr:Amuc_1100 family pilus-like protein [Puniceicoccales bacterium]